MQLLSEQIARSLVNNISFVPMYAIACSLSRFVDALPTCSLKTA
jgi:hypothetical protein